MANFMPTVVDLTDLRFGRVKFDLVVICWARPSCKVDMMG